MQDLPNVAKIQGFVLIAYETTDYTTGYWYMQLMKGCNV